MIVKLRVVQGRPQGKNIVFPRGEYIFGRGTECHVRPNSDCVSRQHCLLRITAEGAYLRDLSSRNGTLINGERFVEERQLLHGDQVQVGPLVFEVLLEEPAEVARPAPDTASALKTVDTAEMRAMGSSSAATREEASDQAPTASEMPTVVPTAPRSTKR